MHACARARVCVCVVGGGYSLTFDGGGCQAKQPELYNASAAVDDVAEDGEDGDDGAEMELSDDALLQRHIAFGKARVQGLVCR